MVRLISDERVNQGKFPVYVVFWEDVSRDLAHPDNRGLLQKYYSGWQEIFGGPPTPEIDRALAERSNYQLALANVEEQRLQERWVLLQAEVARGYVEAARPHILTLVQDMEQSAARTPLSEVLRGRIYRLAATAYLPSRLGGDRTQCQLYLQQARRFSPPEDQDQYDLLEARLRYHTQGPTIAAALVEHLNSPDVIRFRFGLALEQDDLALCGALIDQIAEPTILDTAEWLRLRALYYAKQGDQEQLDQTVRRLTQLDAPAEYYAIAGRALLVIAYRRFSQVCADLHISSGAYIGLRLDELVDLPTHRRAAELFAVSSTLYQQHGCPMASVRMLENAVRLALDDTPSPEFSTEVINRLAAQDPQHPLVRLAARITEPPADWPLDQLQSLLADPTGDVNLVLELVHALPPDPAQSS